MTRSWQLRFLGLMAVIGVLAGIRTPTSAQITPDNTLGEERSVVTPEVIRGKSSDRIDGGATRGANLFHSFREFNVGQERGVYFTNPAGIENIFSRVTGGSRSDILGTLGVLGSANLFLINPNGIIFGQNAILDVGGSFVATTANAIQFANQGSFSTSAPNVPPVLSVNPSAFLFNQIAAQPITVNSIRVVGFDSSGQPLFEGLRVPDSKSLLLLGGNVSLDSGRLGAFGGRVELGGVAGAGAVGLNGDGSLSFPKGGVARADILLANGASVNVAAGGGGSIAVNAQNLDILGGSSLLAGIQPSFGTVGSKAGDIEISATDNVKVEGGIGVSSRIVNLVGDLTGSSALGSAGDIVINTGSLEGIGSFVIGSATGGQGDAGSVTIQAKESVSFDSGVSGGVSSIVGPSGEGNGADITITARSLSLSNASQLVTSTIGDGNAGNIRINASNSISISSGSVLSAFSASQGNAGDIIIDASDAIVSFDGFKELDNDSFLYSAAATTTASLPGFTGTGQGGDIIIAAKSLFVTNGAQLLTGTTGQATNGGLANAGNILVDAVDSVTVSGGSRLLSSTGGQGDAGSVTIRAGKTVLFEGASSSSRSGVISSVFPVAGFIGSRRAGTITIDTDSFTISNGGAVYSNVEAGAEGRGGDIDITASSMSLTEGSQIQSILRDADTVNGLPGGRGENGDVRINVRNTFTANGKDNNGFPSAVLTTVGTGAEGLGGEIDVTAGVLSLFNGGRLQTSTFGVGNSGNVVIQAKGTVSIDEVSSGFTSGIFTDVNRGAVGDGGDIAIKAGSLSLTSRADVTASRADISTSTSGKGNAGNIIVQVNDSVDLSQQSYIFSNVFGGGQGNAGDIYIEARSLTLTKGGQLAASIFREAGEVPGGRGEGGDIQVNATDFVDISGVGLTGFSSGIFTNTQRGALGPGGNIAIKTGAFRVADGAVVTAATLNPSSGGNIMISANTFEASNAQVSTQSQGTGRAGNITINASQALNADNGEIVASSTQSGGGKIEITAGDIRLREDSDIRTNVDSGASGGGDITLTANSIVAFDDSDIFAFANDGQGGDITLDTPAFFGENFQAADSEADNPETLDRNSRVDVSASGAVAGAVSVPDVSFIQNSLTELPENAIDTETTIANSCVTRSRQQGGTFIVTGSGGLPVRPGDASISPYATGEVRSVPSDDSSSGAAQPWKKGDPIVEPTGAYRLSNGEMVMSRECSSF